MTTIVTVDINTGARSERPMTEQEIQDAQVRTVQENSQEEARRAARRDPNNTSEEVRALIEALKSTGVIRDAQFRAAFITAMRNIQEGS